MFLEKVKKIIYGKSLHNRQLIEEYSSNEEKNKRTILAISMFLIPFFYTYFFLIINDGLGDNRIFLYIPVIGIWFYIRKQRIKYEVEVINNCIEREKSIKSTTSP